MKQNNLNLENCALIVEFNASVWTARKLDKGVTDEVIAGKSAASKSAGRFNKNLFAGRSELDGIQKHVTMSRNYIYTHTIPWSDAGQRLLPTTHFLEFDKKLSMYRDQFYDIVEQFNTVYPTLITAQAMALGAMFNRADFPAASDILHRFAFNYDYLPVPSSGDFRVDVGNTAQEELRTRLEAASQARLDKALGDLTTRLVEHLQRMSERLVTDIDDKTGEPKNRKFTHTLVSGAFELCDLIHGLNVRNDPELERSRRTLEGVLSGVTAETLRTDVGKRDDVKRQVDALLTKFQF